MMKFGDSAAQTFTSNEQSMPIGRYSLGFALAGNSHLAFFGVDGRRT